MFSYRHAFHAGNHADVLKHVVLIQLLRHLAAKDAPFWMIDTHAGAGIYSLDGGWAAQRKEYLDGIGRIWGRRDAPPAVADYLALVGRFSDRGRLSGYPGSPLIALSELRPADRLRLFEAHGNEAHALETNVEAFLAGQGGARPPRVRAGAGAGAGAAPAARSAAGTPASPRASSQANAPASSPASSEASSRPRSSSRRQYQITAGDGFVGLKALLPPPPRRGLVLIDPSYEDKADYRRVSTALDEGLKRFATGCFAVWYPIVQRREAHELPLRLARRAPRWLRISLEVRPPASDGLGLYGSGLFIVNPPWTLAATLAATLPWLTQALVEPGARGWALDRSAD